MRKREKDSVKERSVKIKIKKLKYKKLYKEYNNIMYKCQNKLLMNFV